MKPLLINTFDTEGGAAIATHRIHKGLCSIGANSHMLVQLKKSADNSVLGPTSMFEKLRYFGQYYNDQLANILYRKKPSSLFSPALFPNDLVKRISAFNPDIVNLFWILNGFLRIESLKKIKQPLVWTLHDMWPFTGGCHYDDNCGRYRGICGLCPALGSQKENDISSKILQRKIDSWKELSITIVCTSKWMAAEANSSTLFKNKRIEIIPNGIDSALYQPLNKIASRRAYGLPLDKKLILFSAFSATSDKRKGGHLLVEAISHIASHISPEEFELVILGASDQQKIPSLKVKIHYIGRLHDAISQVFLYSAADLVVAPSMQENLSNTVLESLLCGTPVVAFRIGGMPDMIDHKVNGYLADPFDTFDLSAGIEWMLSDLQGLKKMSENARKKAAVEYSIDDIAEKYLKLYEELLINHKN